MRCTLVFAAGILAAMTGVVSAEPITLMGSTTVSNALIAPKKAEIEKLSGQELAIVANGSQRGIGGLLEGKAQIAMISAPVEEEVGKINEAKPGSVDIAKLHVHQVGEAPAVFAVHPSNPVKSLPNAKIAEILSGKIKNWKDAGGPDLAIAIVAAQPGDGVRSTVEKALLGGASLGGDVRAMNQATQVASVVSQLPGAIGVLAAASLNGSVAELKGDAKISQPLILLTTGEESAAVKQVIDAAAKVGKAS
jgi:phosphate transport system substrate-binding protein